MAVRSKAYPSLDLATAISKIELFNKNLGSIGFHPREKVAVGIGYKSLSGASGRAIGALVHYGLLERKKDKYQLTELAKKILFPQKSHDRNEGIREALGNPGLFAELIEQYEGQQIPALLANILTSPQFGINPKVKDEVVQIFRTSVDFAGLLQDDQITPRVVYDDYAESGNFDDTIGKNEDGGLSKQKHAERTSLNDSEMQSMELFMSSGSKAVLQAPRGLTDEDKEKLKTAIGLFS